jgi:hypothetical protein
MSDPAAFMAWQFISTSLGIYLPTLQVPEPALPPASHLILKFVVHGYQALLQNPDMIAGITAYGALRGTCPKRQVSPHHDECFTEETGRLSHVVILSPSRH